MADAVAAGAVAPATVGLPRGRGGDRRFRALRIHQLGRAFGLVDALRDFSLTIRGGEFVALLGPSGSGKSTALNCIAGLIEPTAGEIWLDDERIDGVRPERRGFGMVFQNYSLFPHMSVRRNVAFGLTLRRRPKDEIARRVEDALRLVRLEEHGDKLPPQLSGGEQQRVAIARAVVFEPRLVLMDEPLSNLDAKLRLDLRTEIRRLHQELGLTTIYVTHDQQEALSLADRMVIMAGGRIQQVGTPTEVYGDPETAFVASFIGYRNLLDVEVVVDGDGVVVGGAGFRLRGRVRGEARAGRGRAAIRPDDLVVAPPGAATADHGNCFQARAEVVEFGGREFNVRAVTDAGTPVHAVSRELVEPGQRLSLEVAPERVVVFCGAPGEGT